MTDRTRSRPGGPRSQKLVVVAFMLAVPLTAAGVAAWLAGLRGVGNVLVRASTVVTLTLVAALFVERRERRRTNRRLVIGALPPFIG